MNLKPFMEYGDVNSAVEWAGVSWPDTGSNPVRLPRKRNMSTSTDAIIAYCIPLKNFSVGFAE